MSFHPLNDSPFQRALKRAHAYPGLTADMLQYEIETIRAFVRSR